VPTNLTNHLPHVTDNKHMPVSSEVLNLMSQGLIALNEEHYNYGTVSLVSITDQNQTYFAYFDGVGGTGPELIDQTAYIIKYLIDSKGNITNPEVATDITKPQSIPLFNLKDNFEIGKYAVVKLLGLDPLLTSNPNDNSLTGKHLITGVGRIALLATSELGFEPSDFSTVINFFSPGAIGVSNMTFRGFSRNTGGINPGGGSGMWPSYNIFFTEWLALHLAQTANRPLPNPTHFGTAGGGGAAFNDGTYTFAGTSTTSANCEVGFKYKGTFIRAYYDNTPTTFEVIIVRTTTGTWGFTEGQGTANNSDNWLAYGVGVFDSTDSNQVVTIELDTGLRSFGPNEQIRVFARATWDSGPPTIVCVQDVPGEPGYSSNGNYFEAYQQPVSNDTPIAGLTFVSSSGTTSAGYWALIDPGIYNLGSPTSDTLIVHTGSSAVMASIDLTSVYQGALTYGLTAELTPVSSSTGAFTTPQYPFVPEAGDYIRFEYNPARLYNITEVFIKDEILADTPRLYMRLYPQVPTGSQVNHFTLFKIVDDGNYVILNVRKPIAGNSFTGTIQPEFISTEVIDNFDQVVRDLTQQNLIS
jgi:hypothetical protein